MATLSASSGGSTPWSARLCWTCLRWLYEAIAGARDDTPILIGSPTANGRLLAFDDQCRVCRQLLDGSPTLLSMVPDNAAWSGWPSVAVCPACEAWVIGLAGDGRSARRLAARSVDGEYGDWLHPNLRALRVQVDIIDRAARATVVTVCERMGVRLAGAREQVDVVFTELPSGGTDDPAAAVILMVPFDTRHQLSSALGPRVAGWLTVPVTPQQVAATLAQVARGARVTWDPVMNLPVLRPMPSLPPALSVVPAARVEVRELVWLLRRYARGYDTVGVVAGRIVIIPRVAATSLDAVATRLEGLLQGRASIQAMTDAPFASRLHVSA